MNLNNNQRQLQLEDRDEEKPARFMDMVAYALPVVDDIPSTKSHYEFREW